MAKISKEETERIAELARVGLTDKEKEKFTKQISSILDYVEKLDKVPTEKVEPTSQVTGQKNILVEDKVSDCDISQKELLSNAPETEDGFIKVKRVLEEPHEEF